MRLSPIRGKYVVAVSGGVDSVVLLDHLSKQSHHLELIVAHFDHGIRPDSKRDRQFVEELAKKYHLKFYFREGHLGAHTSEEAAREARYAFLNDTVTKERANGLITAHHQDDQIETAILNIVRGTGRKGLSSLASNQKLLRPLLAFSKADILKYAKERNLKWREDPTNQDLKYLRNYIRLKIVPRLKPLNREQLLNYMSRQAQLNDQIDKELLNILNLKAKDNSLPRVWLNALDQTLSGEILAAWLRQNNLREFDRPTIERLSTQLKTLSAGHQVDVFSGFRVVISRDNLALEHVER